MSDPDEGREGDGDRARQDPGAQETGAQEPVGSVGDEAAKLLDALSQWAREQGTDYVGTATGAAGAFAHAVQDVNEHVATGSQDCRYCPVCQVIHVVRSTSPEVRAHLSVAASSLMQAAAGLLATHTGEQQRSPSVEKIDLDAGADWDEDR